jgi:hypothetical protein
MSFRLVRAIPFLAVAAMPAQSAAQVRASELGTVSQTVDGTVITLEYSRPRVRGRDSVFGKEVKWEEVWTPGANWATTFEINRDVWIDGHPVSQGKYAVWLTVKPEGDWEFLLDPRSHRFHTNRPDTVDGQIRFPIKVTRGTPFAEVLTWSFPSVKASKTTLAMQWSDVRVDLEISVSPTYSLLVPDDRAAPYIGNYTFGWTEPQPWDSAGPRTLTIQYSEGSLVGTLKPELWPGASLLIFLPIAEQWYIPAWLVKGEVYDVDKDIVFEFTLEGGRVTGYEVRETSDKVFAKGEKQK